MLHKISFCVVVAVLIVVGYTTLFPSKTKDTTPVSPKITKANPFSALLNKSTTKLTLLSPFAVTQKAAVFEPKSLLASKDILNVLLIGIDRRHSSENTFNADTMILVSINRKTNKALLTSVPRDVWINNNKINALYAVSGVATLESAFTTITGQPVDGYVLCDFADFKWLVDSFDSVPINVERSFTDSGFPNDLDTTTETVSFNAGLEKMTGARALTFARSRKGNNGEGSDLMRAKRQHLLLKGMLEAVKQPNSDFWPMNIKNFYNTVTTVRKIKTSLAVTDAVYLWDFYKDKDKYSIESFVVDDKYIYHPGLYPASPYHAWVFIPKDPSWSQLHMDIRVKLGM